MPRLTEQEQQGFIRYIEADKPLPDKYRFLLFDEKREVELVWKGKTGEVCNIVLQFQVIEQVDEPGPKSRRTPKPNCPFSTSAAASFKAGRINSSGRQQADSLVIDGPLREEIEAQGG